MEIAVVGLGYVGLPLSALLAEKYDVIGLEADAARVTKLNSKESVLTEPGVDEILNNSIDSGRLKFTTNPSDIRNSTVKIITVGTPYDEKKDDVDYSFLDSALGTVCKQIKKGDVVVLKSTVPVGTTSNRVVKAIKAAGYEVPGDVGVIFAPERIVEGQAVVDYKTLPNIIGASDDRSFKIYSEVVSNAIGGKIVRVSNPETAELVKMTDNYARYTFLALANELALISEKVGVDVLEMISAARDGYERNAGLLTPGPGVGGSCLNKDPFILKSNLSKMGLQLKMVDTAKEINRSMPVHVYGMVKRFRENAKVVAIAGVAFKADTDDTRFSITFTIKNLLESNGSEVKLSDPFVKSVNNVIKDIHEAVKGADVLVILTDHKPYKNIDLKKIKSAMNPNPLIIDARALIRREDAESHGFEYHGLGRLSKLKST